MRDCTIIQSLYSILHQQIQDDKRIHLNQFYLLYLQLNVKLFLNLHFDATHVLFSNCLQFALQCKTIMSVRAPLKNLASTCICLVSQRGFSVVISKSSSDEPILHSCKHFKRTLQIHY